VDPGDSPETETLARVVAFFFFPLPSDVCPYNVVPLRATVAATSGGTACRAASVASAQAPGSLETTTATCVGRKAVQLQRTLIFMFPFQDPTSADKQGVRTSL
jgi:hypothetical protein